MLSRGAQAFKSKYHFNMEGAETQELANSIQTVKLSIASSTTKSVRKNRWAEHMSDIKNACSGLTEEEVRLHECTAMTSWECR
jgi:hypothetical protein